MSKETNWESNEFTKIFREALMKIHSDDWSMEDIAEAAYICAIAIKPTINILTTALSKDTGTYRQGYSAGYNARKRDIFRGKGHTEPITLPTGLGEFKNSDLLLELLEREKEL